MVGCEKKRKSGCHKGMFTHCGENGVKRYIQQQKADRKVKVKKI